MAFPETSATGTRLPQDKPPFGVTEVKKPTKPKDINDLHPTSDEIEELEGISNIVDFKKELEEREKERRRAQLHKDEKLSPQGHNLRLDIPENYMGLRCLDIVLDDIVKPMLGAMSILNHNEWYNIGLGLANSFGGDCAKARGLFVEWTEKYNSPFGEPGAVWEHIKNSKDTSVTFRHIVVYAQNQGYEHLLWHELFKKNEWKLEQDHTSRNYIPIAAREVLYSRSFIVKCALIRRYFGTQWISLRRVLKDYKGGDGKKGCNIGEFDSEVAQVALPGDEGTSEKTLPIDRLLDLAKSELNFFQTADRRAIAVRSLPNGGQENYFIKSQSFRIELRNMCSEQGLILNRETLNTGLEELEAIARRSEIVEFRIRVGKHNDGTGDKHYLDLCDAERRIVEIHKDGWRIVHECPIFFIRKDGMKAIPLPVAGKKEEGIEHLKWLLRANTNEAGYVLGISWLLWSMQEAKEYMNLGVFGGSGSSKSSYCFFLRDLIDPHTLDTRSPSKSDRDMWIALNQQHVYLLDNVSAKRPLRDEDQNILCRVNTGGGRGDKTNYTDEDETVFKVTKPTIINGVNNCITNEDLHSRTIYIEVPPFQDGECIEKEIAYARHEKNKGIALGALLDIFTQGLSKLDTVEGERDIRMVGFSRFAKACESEYCQEGSFVKYFKSGSKDAALELLMGQFVFEILIRTLSEGFNDTQDTFEWEGSFSKLWALMNKFIEDKWIKKGDRYFPMASQALSRWVKYNLPALNKTGWCIAEIHKRGNAGSKFSIKLHKDCKQLFGSSADNDGALGMVREI